MKRALSFVLALVLLVGLMPMQAFATDGTQEPEEIEPIIEPTANTDSTESSEPEEEVAVVHEHEYTAEVTPPTCTEQGYTTYTCECGDSYVDDYVDATGEHSYENGLCTSCGGSARDDANFTHAQPQNQGVANAIARAYQLTDVEWTPLADVPGVKKIDGDFTVITFEAGVTYRGIPYSGVTATDTYVGLNVSLESFLTALQNKNSVLYTENLHSTNAKSATYFGTVCSKFAQYVLDIPGSYNTNNVANIPGVDTIAMPGKYTVDDIKLGDIVLHTQDHTTVCTDIFYDAEGNVAFIEISEAVLPLVRRKLWSPEEFYEHFSGYRLCRYQYLADVPAGPAELITSAEYALMPRFGDKYNYKFSTTKGVVDVLDSGYSKAVIKRDGAIISEIQLNGANTFSFDRSVPGRMEMYLEKSDGTRSGSVYANVVKSSVIVDDSTKFAAGKLTVTIEGSSGTPLYVQVGSAHAIFCNVEGREGTVELTFPTSKISSRQVRVAYQNEYGIYLSNWVSFTAEANPSKDPLLSQGKYWNGYNITPSSPTPVVQEGKESYWSYTMIPVEENTTYYSWGASRLWYLDANGESISTYNAYKESDVPCQFTTPAGTAYVSIAYSPSLVNQGEEKLEKVNPEHKHSYNTFVTTPTCTEQGYTTYTCACGDSYIADETPALGHDYKAAVTEPTCTEAGYTTYTCTCGHSYIGDEVAALGHDYEQVVTAPTCTEGGYTTYTCACSDTYVGNEVEALGHSFTNYVSNGDTTCTEDGTKTAKCDRCNETETVVDSGSAKGHDYEAAVTAPTCTEGGYTTYTCACSDTYVGNEVEALGHSFTNYVSNGDTTCTEDGTKTAKCDRCDVTETVVDSGSAKGHDYKATVTEPSCTKAGYTTYTCTCGHSYVGDEVAALGHDYATGVCSRCDESNPNYKPDRLLGDVNGDGKVTATEYSRLLAHVKKVSLITDADALWAADVNSDGKITAADYSRLLAHVKKVAPLW